MKKGAVISDLHCGHVIGLTPPSHDAKRGRLKEHHKVRRSLWNWTKKQAQSLGKLDFLIVNGDAIDGRGERSGSVELIEVDRDEQCEMAKASIRLFDYDKLFMSYGTPYHTGVTEDWEKGIARDLKAEKIGGEDNLEVLGNTINYRHHIGRSSIPHGRHTAIARERLWNALWAERDEYPKANIIFRSHVHYHAYAGGPGWVAMTTPALCTYGGKYGTRFMSGTVDIGFVYLEIYGKDDFSWRAPILRLPKQKPLSL